MLNMDCIKRHCYTFFKNGNLKRVRFLSGSVTLTTTNHDRFSGGKWKQPGRKFIGIARMSPNIQRNRGRYKRFRLKTNRSNEKVLRLFEICGTPWFLLRYWNW